VTGDDSRWAALFPDLFSTRYESYADCRLSFTPRALPDELIARLHLVARTPCGAVIVCRSIEDWTFLPGGTREENESLLELASRELMEEAGARTTGDLRIFGAHVADSLSGAPFRPHLPHPRAYWAYAATDAELVQPPTNPHDGEHVVEVLALPATEAAGRLEYQHADVLRLAQAMQLI
jgi:8-oxo-dGTP diphosphatase